jgi:hypothetical protein
MKLIAIDTVASQMINSTILYRYISIESLKYFIKGSFSLNRVSAWPDRMECADFEFLQSGPKTDEKRLAKDFFASCWTTDQILENSLPPDYSVQLANDELKSEGSASMWEDYCKNGGIRVATTLEKLLSIFEIAAPAEATVYYGLVNYMAKRDNARFNNLERIEKTLFQKRIGFQHENEFRFVGNFADENENYVQISVPNYWEFLDEILVFPIKNSGQIDRAKRLHDLGVCLAAKNWSGNSKNGRHFCKVSQLYGQVSNEIGNIHLLDRD